MEIEDLKEKTVAVLGYGVEGKAVTAYLLKHGIRPVLFDEKPWEQWPADQQEAIKKLEINFIFGPSYLEELGAVAIAFRSPGVPRLHPKLLEWEQKGLQITSQTKWFFEHCPAKIIGVTGTKGKGTTSALLYEILSANKFEVLNSKFETNPKDEIPNTAPNTYLTGNIGDTQPLEILDNLQADDYIVYELSSFQLQDLTQSPHLAVVLMVTQEHLDYHTSLEEYHKAKTAISKYQNQGDTIIYNIDYPATKQLGQMSPGMHIPLSTQQILEQGSYRDGQDLKIKNIGGQNFSIPISNVGLTGSHNLENVLAAMAAAAKLSVKPNTIEQTIQTFKGLPNRLELVADKSGIYFYNDSFSTTPETAIAAINSFSEPEIVILGGSGKNSDFSALGKTIVTKDTIKAIIFIGPEAARIEEAITKAGTFPGQMLRGAQTMAEIFNQIKQLAVTGDVVLLSPACASFGMFKNYKDRGEQFKDCATNYSV